VTLFSGGPLDGSLPDMDLQKLTDIALNFSTTHAARTGGSSVPILSECVRIDF
jgi:hypothetical protein